MRVNPPLLPEPLCCFGEDSIHGLLGAYGGLEVSNGKYLQLGLRRLSCSCVTESDRKTGEICYDFRVVFPLTNGFFGAIMALIGNDEEEIGSMQSQRGTSAAVSVPFAPDRTTSELPANDRARVSWPAY